MALDGIISTLSETPLPPNVFPAEAFDQWAAEYDGEVAQEAGFPFTGYRTVLQRTFELASPHAVNVCWTLAPVQDS
jgi:hypothetical protein